MYEDVYRILDNFKILNIILVIIFTYIIEYNQSKMFT